MSVIELLATLKAKDIQLSLKGDQLLVQGNKQALSEPAILASMREHKPALIAMIRAGDYSPSRAGSVEVPANAILPGTTCITPSMLTLATLDQAAIERIVATVPGGAGNVQDIYPLAPLQEGILFHHVSAAQGDPYIMQSRFAFDSRERLDDFVRALQGVIDRHDILRTGVVWQGLERPMQVVWRQATLPVEALHLDPANGEIAAQLHQRFDGRRYRIDVTQAPLLRLVHAWDAPSQRIVAMLMFHHMALDHSALEVVSQEMQAFLLGRSARLGDAVPFRTYVAHALLGVSEQEHEAFFREMLGDIDEPTLPFGLQDVQGDGHAIEEARREVDAELGRRLRTRARHLGVSAASLFHLAWAQVLAVVSGKQRVVFGTVLMGRMLGADATDRALGIFINTLPFRVDIGGASLHAAVKATHARLTTLLRHEHAPLALAQRCSAVVAPTPLFSALLNYRHSASSAANASAEALAAWRGIAALSSEERTNYPLTLSVDDLGEHFALTALTAPGIDAARICGYLHQALENLVWALEQPADPASTRLAIIPPSERRQLLLGFNDTRRDYPDQLTVHGVFEALALAQPEAIAVVHGEQILSYRQLNIRANRLAHHLISLGLKPGDHVAILLERSVGLLVSQLAISKCAAAYVALDIHAPAERQRFMVEDSRAHCVLSPASASLDFPARRIDPDQLPSGEDVPTHNPQLAQSAEALAYIMYTSGSTGTPKGVLVPHRAITRLVINNGYADFNPQDRVAFASNPAFDASTMDVWGPLLNGGQVLVIDRQTLLDPTRFGEVLSQSGATVLFVTTALFNQYVQLIPEALKGLRILLCGGERADPAAFRRLLAFAPELRLVHCYGPTETTTYATTYEVKSLAADADSVPIGRPISNTQIYLLDAFQQPVPIGVVGEICIGGQGVAKGYLNRPELTAEKFVPDVFSGNPQALLYRTGDLGRWNAQGLLECLGRNDDQVKIRGFRIELGEIEARLATCPGVKDVVVLAREDVPGDKRLVAYYTVHGAALSGESLRAHMQNSLPDYMIPSACVHLPKLPLNANGKVERKALPAPDHAALLTREYQAPQGEIETVLAQIWAEVLQVEQVGREDHFFELGGHSLLAMRMVSRVRLRLGVELALNELFANPQLSAVAQVLAEAGRSTLPAIMAGADDEGSPLSFAQQRLWFLAQMDGGNSAYNIAASLRLRGRLDVAALQRALARIVERHATLRSRFVEHQDQPQVSIDAAATLRLQIEDWRDQAQSPQALRARIQAEAAQPFDLQHGPLIRGSLLTLADDHHVLLVSLHHIVADGWSMGVLTAELIALYQAFSQGEADPLPALAVQYGDFARWQRRWLSGELLQRQSEYWQQALAGAPALLLLPTDRPRPAQQDYAGSSVDIRLDEQLTAALKALSQRHGTTLYMMLMAAWAAVLSR
ncbi:non-ribosomal peptide synthetase, partial [Pseudomonas sp. 43NM1]|uniref:non-ribosomal peptide synthetase n=1 Tax=Pseudomonas sp. 43NM1 TaxID=1904755 RepID=UPI0012FE80D5